MHAMTPGATAEDAHSRELERGERFEFGENWARFLSVLDDERIAEAERSLERMLGEGALRGATFLDLGCGSGLFSLAAVRLGAARVHSLDFDPSSVGCAIELRRRYFPDAEHWTIAPGSALDRAHPPGVAGGETQVLHHTGDMWTAMDNATAMVAPRGRLFVSIYNDQGRRSRMWRLVKRTYNALPLPLRTPFAVLAMAPTELRGLVGWTLRGRPWRYVQTWTDRKRTRGMSRWHDLVDWVGGYPFEVATPDAVFDFCRERDFVLERLVTRQGIGCNEFVFVRSCGRGGEGLSRDRLALQHRHETFRRAPVPQRRDAPRLAVRALDQGRDLADAFRAQAEQRVRADGDRHRAFGVVAQGEARDAEVCRLLLDAAGVGHDRCGVCHEAYEIEVAERRHDAQPAALRLDPAPLEGVLRPRVGRQDHRDVAGDVGQCLDRGAKQWAVDECGAVQRHDYVVALAQAVAARRLERGDVAARRDERVDHRVADVVD